MKLIDKIEINFKDRPLTTRVVGTFITLILIELVKLIYSLIAKANLKPLIVMLFQKEVSLAYGWLIILILLSIFAPYILKLVLKKRITSVTITDNAERLFFRLKKQNTDDHFYNNILELSGYNYEIQFKPDLNTDYWRFGIKLSHIENIADMRYTKGNPLFHLTKWIDKKWVGVTYYDENNRLWKDQDRILIKDYNKEVIKIKIYNTSDKTIIAVINFNNVELYVHEIQKYLYAKVLAWGDEYSFKFDCEISKSKRIQN